MLVPFRRLIKPNPTVVRIHATAFGMRYFFVTLTNMPQAKEKGATNNVKGRLSTPERIGEAFKQAWKNTGL